jgi:hypothetical protein
MKVPKDRRGLADMVLASEKGRIPELLPLRHIKDQLPTVFHDKENPPGKINKILQDAMAGYRATLPTAYQSLLDRFELHGRKSWQEL